MKKGFGILMNNRMTNLIKLKKLMINSKNWTNNNRKDLNQKNKKKGRTNKNSRINNNNTWMSK